MVDPENLGLQYYESVKVRADDGSICAVLFGEPVPTPDRVGGRLSPGHAPGEAAMLMRTLFAAALCAGLALHAAPADAQAYPSRPIQVVIPFPPGGPTDGMARIVSDRLGAVLGVPIVVENKGGAGGGIGGKYVAQAEPDGYTILMSPGGSLTTGPLINPNIGYDPVKSLIPVAQLVEMPIIAAVNPDL